MEVIENIETYVKKTKFLNRQMSYLSPLCQLQLFISQNTVGLCDLLPDKQQVM